MTQARGVSSAARARVTAPPITLRLARSDDVSLLEALIPLSARALQAATYSPAQIEGALGTVFALDRQPIANETYFVAERDSEMVGCGGWSRRKTLSGGDRGRSPPADPPLGPSCDAARIQAFFVHPEYVRRGIGRLMMSACERAAAEGGFRAMELVATLAGEPLYARSRFRSSSATTSRWRTACRCLSSG